MLNDIRSQKQAQQVKQAIVSCLTDYGHEIDDIKRVINAYGHMKIRKFFELLSTGNFCNFKKSKICRGSSFRFMLNDGTVFHSQGTSDNTSFLKIVDRSTALLPIVLTYLNMLGYNSSSVVKVEGSVSGVKDMLWFIDKGGVDTLPVSDKVIDFTLDDGTALELNISGTNIVYLTHSHDKGFTKRGVLLRNRQDQS